MMPLRPVKLGPNVTAMFLEKLAFALSISTERSDRYRQLLTVLTVRLSRPNRGFIQ